MVESAKISLQARQGIRAGQDGNLVSTDLMPMMGLARNPVKMIPIERT